MSAVETMVPRAVESVGKTERGNKHYSLHKVEGLRAASLWSKRFHAEGWGCLPGGVPLLQEVEGWRTSGEEK